MKTQTFPFTNCLIIFLLSAYLSTQRSQFLQGLFTLFLIRRFAVPVEILLHKVHALAGNGVSDNANRLFKNRSGLKNSVVNSSYVIAIYFQNMPAKSVKFLVQWFKRHYVFGKSIYLDIVSVYYRRKIVQLIFTRPQRRFPSLSAIKLAVAH